MKKVGILTYHNTTNYGAILQAYALQKKLIESGNDCDIIDYRCEAIEKNYKIIKINQSKNIKQLIKSILANSNKKCLKEKFEKFKDENLKISKDNYNRENINEVNDKYDEFVVGSDQVWNLNLCGGDTTYMLDFVKEDKKKNSYAASFGYNEVPKKYVDTTKRMLNTFKNICVREEQGKKIIQDLIEKQADVTLDPTLLLNKKQWYSLIKNSDKNEKNEEFILLYIVSPNKEIINFTKRLAKKEKCKIIFINNSIKNVFGMKNIKTAGPEEFLKYIKDAKYVVTTSFHGVAFSINLEKQFFYGLSSENNNFNSRIENLINILGLQDRKIKNEIDNYKKIDYKKVNNILEEQRISSIEKIKNI